VVLQDLLEITHDITLLKAMDARDEAFKHTSLPVSDVARCKKLATDIGIPNLQRAWTILLKGLQEAQHAPDAKAAAEMAVMRLIYAADLPDPARLIREIQSGAIPQGGGAMETRTPVVHAPLASDNGGPTLMAISGGGALRKAEPVVMLADALPQPENFEALVTLCEDKGEMLLASQLMNYTHPVKFELGRFDFRPAPEAPANLAQKLSTLLQQWTGTRWMISVSTAAGEATLTQKKYEAKEAQRQAVLDSPNVKAILAAFPGSEIHSITKSE